MIKTLLILSITFNCIYADTQNELLKSIKTLIEQNGKKIEQNLASIKTIQSQVSFIQTLLVVVLGGVIASPFFVIYLQRKDDKLMRPMQIRTT